MIYSVRKRNKALYKIKYSTRSHFTLTSNFLAWLSGRNSSIIKTYSLDWNWVRKELTEMGLL